ncbi:chaperone SicP [Salmonella enterica subsp. enterica serovar Muenchen]|uniref:chaperone SicP n=1 Tax=Salmonella enterica TaxID=28901 RepID=UPI000BA04A54|nr:chaperone SicP [Salmonella enterica]EBX0575665.1 chaperone SicP [Salmonella enterica subsp. enterica serovar Utah]ECD5989006.1 chaperone SicP [Salmonella enterica subsp. enterica serovar Muenchen]ECR1919449.1 chaperone SicP [Salmonella enterica subsp. enterica serovar Johannesburg]EDI0784404.1 chaperone SicP [Salmonella enterica subsp. enterica serovar Kasenyi]EDZ9940533.1 chaperone SicP [Salmonella enterica subsp. enterica serovar Nessziona]EEA6506663.1 chaperone SicP [Salmonella enterica
MYQHDRIISETGEILGLPLDFDEEGQCALQFDENLFVSFQIWKNDTWLLTGLLLDTLPPEPDNAFWKKIMMLNGELAMENAGNLVYSEEDNALLLMDTVTDLSNAHAIISHLENFVNRQESLIQVLQ